MAYLMTRRKSGAQHERESSGEGNHLAAQIAAGALLRSAARQAIIAAAADAIASLNGHGAFSLPEGFDPFGGGQPHSPHHKPGKPGGPGGEDDPNNDGNKTRP